MKKTEKNGKHKGLHLICIIAAAFVTVAGAVLIFLKRKTILRRFNFFMMTVAVIFCGIMMCGTMTVFAATEPKTEQYTTATTSSKDTTESETTERTEESETTTESEIVTGSEIEIDITDFISPDSPPQQLTPSGNLTLSDDLSGVLSDEKQFITVTTKNGNYFYIIIDRAGDKDNVHFLNLVDEADLLALLEEKNDKPVTSATTTEESTEQTIVEPTPKAKNNGNVGLLIMFAVIAASGGGAYYYFKVRKPKHGGKNTTSTPALDELDFDTDENDFIKVDTGEQDDKEYDSGYIDEEISDFDVDNEDNE